MGKSKVIGFNAEKWQKDLTDYWVGQQNARLIAYAKNKILQIGNRIHSYSSRKHMDNTGNLLDSLCWGLSYNQKLVQYGFYRDQKATQPSYLHEFWRGGLWKHRNKKKNEYEAFDHWNLPAIYGREMAERFSSAFASSQRARRKGWTLFFAILTPYWGYWENGFTFRGGGGSSFVPSFQRTLHFPVMAETRDMVASELSPAKIGFHVHVEHYTNTGLAKTAKRGVYKNLTYK